MSAIKDVLYEVQEAIMTLPMTYSEIADTYGISVEDVQLIADELNDMIETGEGIPAEAVEYAYAAMEQADLGDIPF